MEDRLREILILHGMYGIENVNESMQEILRLFDVSGSLHHPIKFGRWLLKYAKEGWDEGLLCWQYEGKFYNTDELYEEFCRQQ